MTIRLNCTSAYLCESHDVAAVDRREAVEIRQALHAHRHLVLAGVQLLWCGTARQIHK